MIDRRALVVGGVAAAASACSARPPALEKSKGDGQHFVPRNFFGIHVANASPNGIYQQPQTPFPNIGVRAVRLWDSYTTWRLLEPEPGQFDFKRLDFLLNQAQQHGAQVMLTLGQPPFWAAPGVAVGAANNPRAPSQIRDWTTYVQTVVEYCGRRVSFYDIWNEPDAGGFDGTLPELLRLAQAAYPVIKKLAPHAVVTTPSFCIQPEMKHRAVNLRNWLQAGGASVADAIALHAYEGEGNRPEHLIDLLGEAAGVIRSFSADRLPVYDTESGSRGWRDELGQHRNASPTFGDPLPTSPVNLQAAYVTRHLLSVLSTGMMRQSYYYTFDNPDGTNGTQTVMAILMTDFPSKPSAILPPALAYKYIATLLPRGFVSPLRKSTCWQQDFTTSKARMGRIYWTDDYESASVTDKQALSATDNLGRPISIANNTIKLNASPVFVFYN